MPATVSESAMPPIRASGPGRRLARTVAFRHDGQAIWTGGRRRISSRMPPMPPIVNVRPSSSRAAASRANASDAPGSSRPAMTARRLTAPR